MAAPPPRWAIVTWSILIAALIGLFAFAGRVGVERMETKARPLQTIVTLRPSSELRRCLERRFPLTDRLWSEVDGDEHHLRRWNNARGVRIDVIDTLSRRDIVIATPSGRSLRRQEAEAIRLCLANG